MIICKKSLLVIFLFIVTNHSIGQTQSLQFSTNNKTTVIENLSVALQKNYIFSDTATKMANQVKTRLKNKDYESITNPNEFAQKLTNDLRSVYNDIHLSIVFDPRFQARIADTSKITVAEKRQQNLAEYRQKNFGFNKLEILRGNIGYLSFDQFYGFNEFTREVVNTAFTFLKNTNALVIDLRNNGGGSPETVKYISSFLLPLNTQLSSLYERRTNQTETAFTYQPSIPVSFAGKPIYILVSRRTFSAAEAFSYDMQKLQKATLIGETTGGGAHTVDAVDLGNGFTALVPFARAINPITNTNWEAVGVKPDIEINADMSLDAAVLSYYDFQINSLKDSNAIKSIKWSRDMLNAKLHPYPVDSITLKTYVGNFADRIISLENGILCFTGRDGKKSKMIAITKTIFKIETLDNFKLEFLPNAAGKVNEVNFIFEDGFTTTFKRKE
jgi:hypothetical protein